MQSYNLPLFLIIALPILLLNRWGFWLLFKKAGVNPWISIIPFYNWFTWVKIVGRPTYYFFLLFVPIINPIIWFTLSIDLLKSFGRFKFYEQVLGTLFQFAYLPYIGYQKDVVYIGPAESEDFQKKYPKKKEMGRDWADAIWFAVMVASLVRMIYVEPYQIPTQSMERSLRVGDYLFVSKLHNGFRVPSTPISIPFVHRDLAGIPSYNKVLTMPYIRIPGWVDVKAGDPTVFNWPADDMDFPIDKKQNFIKRCMAGPGDSIRLANSFVYLNGKKLSTLQGEQYSYIVGNSKYPLRDKEFDKLDIYDVGQTGYLPQLINNLDSSSRLKNLPLDQLKHIMTNEATLDLLQKKGVIDMVFRLKGGASEILYPNFPTEPYLNWTVDDCGPYYCPKRGDVIDMSIPENAYMYGYVIKNFEDNKNVEQIGPNLTLNGEKLGKYTFRYNYYWMMGDNRHNSLDSRIWGFVPESHILGKPLLVLFSVQYKQVNGANKFEKIRWNRFFKGIN